MLTAKSLRNGPEIRRTGMETKRKVGTVLKKKKIFV